MTNKQLILDFFARHARKPLPAGDAALNCFYLDDGIIDSLGIVTMVTEFESALGIQFTADDMQSDEFLTVGGLIAIADRLTTAKK